MVRIFTVVLERDDGWWVAHVPALLTEEYFARRAKGASRAEFLAALSRFLTWSPRRMTG